MTAISHNRIATPRFSPFRKREVCDRTNYSTNHGKLKGAISDVTDVRTRVLVVYKRMTNSKINTQSKSTRTNVFVKKITVWFTRGEREGFENTPKLNIYVSIYYL